MKLRPYQNEAIEAIEGDWRKGEQMVMVSMATGLGKTVVFSKVVGRFVEDNPTKKVIVVAHRKELLEQARSKMQAIIPSVADDIGLYQASTKEVDKRIIVASVQSCSKKRIKELPLKEIGLIVIDEFHHATASSYGNLLVALKEASPNYKGLGVTATPFRGDKVGLGDLVNKISYSMPIRRGIEEGWLTPLKGIQVQLNVDFNELRKTAGDFNAEDLDALVGDEGRQKAFVEAWLAHCGPYTEGGGSKGRSTACFTPTVKTAKAVAQMFISYGIRAEWVSGETPAEERKDRLERFSEGGFPVIVNCGVLTEGWDAPRTSCIALMRPTQSQVLYIQMVGRGTRLFEGKKDCIVLDCVGTSKSNSLLTLADLSSGSLDEEVEKKEKDPVQEHLLLLGDPQTHTVRVKGYNAVHFDVFGNSPVVWFEANGARVTSDGYWSYLIYENKGQWFSSRARLGKGIHQLSSDKELTEVVKATESCIIKELQAHPKERKLIRASRWLSSRPLTSKQKGLISSLASMLVKRYGSSVGFNRDDLDAMSTQTASTIITYLVVKSEYAKKNL